ncbi:hypothetical protein D9M70_435630 [compost metagenome]
MRHALEQLLLDHLHVLAGRQPGAVRDPEDVRIDRNGGLAERRIEDHVGGLAAHARQRFQRFAVGRDLAAVPLDQHAAGLDHMLGLGLVQADGLDVFAQPGLAEVQHLLRRVRDREQPARGLVDADVGGLRRQQHGDQQLERRTVFQFSGRGRVDFAQRLENGTALGGVHCCGSGSGLALGPTAGSVRPARARRASAASICA